MRCKEKGHSHEVNLSRIIKTLAFIWAAAGLFVTSPARCLWNLI
jgi:hypothetical protein